MTEQLDVQQMAQRLLAADNILILCHKNPDGDTIGCGSALYYALKALEKTTAVLCSDAIPSRYAFTNPRLFKGEFEPRTVIAVDVAGLQLFGENNGVPQFARHVDLCIDHHAGNNGYADFTLLDAGAAAAAELLYQVIVEMGVTITPHIADCLYTGIATDTGCFKFSSTTANTHKVAAKLIEAGCHVEELNTLLFDTKPRARMEAERIARNHLEYYLDGRCALIYLTRDEIRQSGVDPADLEELTSLPISIEGVKVGLTLRQQPGGSYRISVRTAKGVDACAIARRLGGGGHALPDQLCGHRLAGEGHAQLQPDPLRHAAPGLAGLAHAFRSGPDPAQLPGLLFLRPCVPPHQALPPGLCTALGPAGPCPSGPPRPVVGSSPGHGPTGPRVSLSACSAIWPNKIPIVPDNEKKTPSGRLFCWHDSLCG